MNDSTPFLEGFEPEEKKQSKKTNPEFLPWFDEPQTDDQRLLNLQREYLKGDSKAMDRFYMLGYRVAIAEAKKIMRSASGQKYRHIHCAEDLEDAARDAITYLCMKLQKGEAFEKSVTGYLYLQVHEKVGYRTKAFLSQEFTDIEEMNRGKAIERNAFEQRESEKETEREINRIYAENFTLCNEGDEVETYAYAFRCYVEKKGE